MHIHIRCPDCTQVCRRKGWSTRLWVGLKGAILGIFSPRLILGERTVESLLRILGGHGQSKPMEGVCKVYPMDTLVTPTFVMWHDYPSSFLPS